MNIHYDWISKKEVLKHIKKHILNIYNKCSAEEEKWEKEFSDLNYEGLKFKSDEDIENHNLFNAYQLKSNEVASNENFCYIFKSGDNYSCNYKRDDDLTTCLRLDYNYSRPAPKVISCFFRVSTVIDATVMLYITKYLNDNSIKSVNFDVKGLFLNEKNFESAKKVIRKTFQDNYNNEPKIDISLRFVSEYLKRQYDYYLKAERENEVEYFKYLIQENRKSIDSAEKERLLKLIKNEKNKIIDIYTRMDLEYSIIDETIKFLDLCECSINNIENENNFKEEAYNIISSF